MRHRGFGEGSGESLEDGNSLEQSQEIRDRHIKEFRIKQYNDAKKLGAHYGLNGAANATRLIL